MRNLHVSSQQLWPSLGTVAAFPRAESQDGQAETVSTFVTWLQKSKCVTYPRVAPSLDFGGGSVASASLREEGQSWWYKDLKLGQREIPFIANFGKCGSPQRRERRQVSSSVSPWVGNILYVHTASLTSQHGTASFFKIMLEKRRPK